jgi:hypothetical protein
MSGSPKTGHSPDIVRQWPAGLEVGGHSCARVALGDETLSGVVLLIRSAGTIGVPDGTDLRDGRSVTSGGGGAWAGSCSDSSLTWLLGSLLTCPAVSSFDELGE